MGNRIDWPALELLIDLNGVADVPLLVEQLCAIRDYFAPKPKD